MAHLIRNYLNNCKAVLRTYNNQLKKPENLKRKDLLEKEFYDDEAEKYLNDFDESMFLFDENEEFPDSHNYFYSQLEEIEGMRILDCGCGHGCTSVKLAKRGAEVFGIDISPKMIELSQKNADLNSVRDIASFKVMSAQDMEFEDNTFDIAVGMGALHHLNLNTFGRELRRVLKPGGRALFVEPRIPFKFLILLRSIIPVTCFESPGGSQLTDREIREFSKFFSHTDIKYYIFLRKIAHFTVWKRYKERLDVLDRKIAGKYPFLRKFYWSWVLQFTL
ncbi:class I SAM-dependent methyltransferase [candidate division KSB1 bacterium]